MEGSRDHQPAPGPVVLFGSGETTPSGRKIFEAILHRVRQPAQVAMLETPAGFELNSPQVAGRVGDFVSHRLQNLNPQVRIIPARKRDTPFSPDNPQVVEPLYSADLIFMGPGSPTYAVRQLRDSLAWHALVACQRLGAGLALASAATVAISAKALPVYEIYKVGEDPHWKDGLDFFAPYGLSLVIIPHWNNQDGGEELDTSRCFIGRARFDPLVEQLSPGYTIVGIDEQTGFLFDLAAETCRVIGSGSVTVRREGRETCFEAKQTFAIRELGDFRAPEGSSGIPPNVWRRAVEARSRTRGGLTLENLPEEILKLLKARQSAREERNWQVADQIRDKIAERGWQVSDTPEGQRVEPLNNQ